MEHLAIIGNGIAGITTARHVRKRSDMKITVISAETEHFYSRTALMYVYMGHMSYEDIKPYEDWFWEKNRLDLVNGFVTRIDTDNKTLHLQGGRTIEYDKLLVATGSKSNKFGWPGQDLPGVQGLYSFQDLQSMEENTKNISHAVIVGGGLIGIEVGEMLHSRDIPVTFLVREDFYWNNVLPQEEAQLVTRHIIEHGFGIRLKTQLKEILPDENGRVRAVVTEFGEEIPCQFVTLTPGVHPNLDVVKESKIAAGRGVIVNDYLETNIPDVYAAGDCAEIKSSENDERGRVEQLWYTGRLQGETLARTICGERTKYDRGVWYNSAKFLDIEYQTYGVVPNQLQDGNQSFYWEHPDGKKCLRIVYNEKDNAVTGFNFLGLRFRQDICESWIKEKKSLEYVLAHFREGNFDPEFFKKHEREIIRAYKKENPHSTLQIRRKPGLFRRMFA